MLQLRDKGQLIDVKNHEVSAMNALPSRIKKVTSLTNSQRRAPSSPGDAQHLGRPASLEMASGPPPACQATAPALAQRRASRRTPAPHLQRQRPEDVEAQRLREEIRELLRARDLLQRPIRVLDEPLVEGAQRDLLMAG